MSRSLHVAVPDAPVAVTRPTSRAVELRIVPIAEPDYTKYVEPVNNAASHAARRYRLSPSDADDLRSDLWLKLLENHGRVLRHLGHLARFDVYLKRIARNLVLDRRNKEWGKWRPSAAARRAGDATIVLDRLITRDGLTIDEAEAWLRCAGHETDTGALHDAASQLPARQPRRFVSHDALAELSSPSPSPYDVAAAAASVGDLARLKHALVEAFEALPALERDLLARRYFHKVSVADIAAEDGVDAKRLYRTFGSILGRLGRALVAAGVDRTTARRLLQTPHQDFDCGLEAPMETVPQRDRRPA
jgi:RNA polymerase sigma factor (sigma-70 family)